MPLARQVLRAGDFEDPWIGRNRDPNDAPDGLSTTNDTNETPGAAHNASNPATKTKHASCNRRNSWLIQESEPVMGNRQCEQHQTGAAQQHRNCARDANQTGMTHPAPRQMCRHCSEGSETLPKCDDQNADGEYDPVGVRFDTGPKHAYSSRLEVLPVLVQALLCPELKSPRSRHRVVY